MFKINYSYKCVYFFGYFIALYKVSQIFFILRNLFGFFCVSFDDTFYIYYYFDVVQHKLIMIYLDVHHISKDFKQAHDAVDRRKLWHIVKESGFLQKLIHWTMDQWRESE